MALRGAKCIVLGIDTNYPRQTFCIRDLTPGQVIMRQVAIWHPTAEEAVFSDTATKGGGGGTRALFTATQDNLPLHVLSGEPGSRFEGAGIGTAWTEEGAGGSEGAFKLERVEHEMGGVFGPEGKR